MKRSTLVPMTACFFRKKFASKDVNECKCRVSRWKNNANKIQSHVLRYLPLKPSFQRLFLSSKSSKETWWNHEENNKDGVLQHPIDFESWKSFDSKYPKFATCPCNVRQGLTFDRFNPFGTMRTAHSTWRVIWMTYNIPPGMFME